jgi:hypothetical protein
MSGVSSGLARLPASHVNPNAVLAVAVAQVMVSADG